MQADEDVGKIAMAVPLLVCEYFFNVCSTFCFFILYMSYLFLILSLMILSVAVHKFCFNFNISPFLFSFLLKFIL
jgi:hypothetical protein